MPPRLLFAVFDWCVRHTLACAPVPRAPWRFVSSLYLAEFSECSLDSHAVRLAPGARYGRRPFDRDQGSSRASRRSSSPTAPAAGRGQREWGGMLQRSLVMTGTNIS
jgi:hypothetical protein